ncbi:protein RAFTIN 1B-like [Panicum miliaceum]|uniref:Protein RAFTIN 1B-like n=1 Tax=Panicum miliaceum TaxID=4540 RepID=A0A3L6TMJ1_PANMI|nr:protein RAFTIN 1B-like [Panicum miliaceum]
MARLLHSAIISTFVLLVVGQRSNAVLTEAEVFWRTVLPDSPLPDPILKLLHPETSFVNKPRDDTVAEAYSLTWLMWGLRSPSGPTKHSNGAETSFVNKPKDDTAAEAYSLTWLMWGLRSPSGPTTKHSSPRPSHGRDHSTDEYLAQGLFFHEELVQVGKTITLYFPLAASAPLGLLPRHVADSIPFSTSSLPRALARLGIADNSVQAANMEETLYMCDLPPKAGEAKFCATSLEALVEGSMAALGTRNIRPMTSDLPRTGAPKQPYTVRAVHPVDGSSFVSCHDHNYPYTVYMCHNTPSTRAYIVDLEGTHSGLVVTVAAICHADTSNWNSEHVSFKILGTKPGGAPICHYLPYGHNVWVNMEENRSSS